MAVESGAFIESFENETPYPSACLPCGKLLKFLPLWRRIVRFIPRVQCKYSINPFLLNSYLSYYTIQKYLGIVTENYVQNNLG